MKMRCFYLCLKLCPNLEEELCPEMFLAGKHLALKRLAQTAHARSKTGKQSLISIVYARNKTILEDRFARTRLVVLARNIGFTIPWAKVSQVCSEQTSSTGTPGSTPERTQLGLCWLETAFQPSTSSSIRCFKKTSYVQTQLFAF